MGGRTEISERLYSKSTCSANKATDEEATDEETTDEKATHEKATHDMASLGGGGVCFLDCFIRVPEVPFLIPQKCQLVHW